MARVPSIKAVAPVTPAVAALPVSLTEGDVIEARVAAILQNGQVRLATALGVRPRLVAVPETWLRVGGRLLGASAQVSRLCGSLRVDSSALAARLGWSPPSTVDEELRRTASWFRSAELAYGG